MRLKKANTEPASGNTPSNNSKPGGKLLLIIVYALIMAAVIVGINMIVSNIILSFGIENIQEIANHDSHSILTSIESKEDTLSGWALMVRSDKCESIGALMREISNGSDVLGAARLYLIDEDYTFYGSDSTITPKDGYIPYLENMASDSTIIRYDSFIDGITAESRKQNIAIIQKIREFTVDGHVFKYALAELDIKTFQDKLKIDSYNGQGYTNIVSEENGYYVVSISITDVDQRESIFDKMKNRNAKIEGFSSVDDFAAAFASIDNLTVSLTLDAYDEFPAGRYVLVVTDVENTNWKMTTLCPVSVFSSLSNRITFLFVFLAIILMLSVAIVVFLSYRIRVQHEKQITDERHHKELSEALVLAQQSNRSKTTFLNNMSHDIRTPMNAIIGFTALASTHLDNKDIVRDYLSKIEKSSEHLLSLINDVLDMSRIESGKVTINEKEENLAEIIHNLRDIIQADVNAKQLNFYTDTVDVKDEYVICDKLRLNQVLLNIVSNALKYTEPGGTIAFRLIQKGIDEDGRASYEFRVKDSGIGMSEEFAKTIFEPFTREQTSTVSGIQGTGLGMAITKNIVDMMGGTISVKTKLHEGSEFIVNLSFRLAGEKKSFEVIEKLEGLKSLVVDDDINACQSISDMLRAIGMRAEWCVSGKESIVRSEEAMRIGDGYSVYIIDWLMPDMNGIETTRRIRQVVGSDAPVIILTAYDWRDIEDEAINAGVTAFLNKPLFQSDLNRVLSKYCGDDGAEENEGDEKSDFSGKRILLVEDNELNREIAVGILGEAGFEIETAENGLIGSDKLMASEPGYFDLVLMDIQMPVMDGYEAARRIRSFDNPVLAEIPIIAMTANAFEEDKALSKAAGMNDHLTKPIEIPVLFETLKRIL